MVKTFVELSEAQTITAKFCYLSTAVPVYPLGELRMESNRLMRRPIYWLNPSKVEPQNRQWTRHAGPSRAGFRQSGRQPEQQASVSVPHGSA
jgi:hypothetical protein